MKTFGEFLFCSVSDAQDLSSEVESLSGHGGIEVHRHLVILYFNYHSVTSLTGGVEHRDEPADFQKILTHGPIHHERALGDVEHF